jgi:hypothetical protein
VSGCAARTCARSSAHSPRRGVAVRRPAVVGRLRDGAGVRGRAGRSPPGRAVGSGWMSPWSNRGWWWKSASMSLVRPPAGGVTLRAGIAPAPGPTSPPPTFSASRHCPGERLRSGTPQPLVSSQLLRRGTCGVQVSVAAVIAAASAGRRARRSGRLIWSVIGSDWRPGGHPAGRLMAPARLPSCLRPPRFPDSAAAQARRHRRPTRSRTQSRPGPRRQPAPAVRHASHPSAARTRS